VHQGKRLTVKSGCLMPEWCCESSNNIATVLESTPRTPGVNWQHGRACLGRKKINFSSVPAG
jgi:hypothetical protein